jgi:hypothetical protein
MLHLWGICSRQLLVLFGRPANPTVPLFNGLPSAPALVISTARQEGATAVAAKQAWLSNVRSLAIYCVLGRKRGMPLIDFLRFLHFERRSRRVLILSILPELGGGR